MVTETGGYEEELIFFDRRSQRTTNSTIAPLEWCVVTNAEIVVLWLNKNIKIVDTYGQLMTTVPELDEDERISWNVALCCISEDQMAVLSHDIDVQEKLSLWDVRDPSNVTRLMSETYHLNMPFGYNSLMKMDDQLIAISTFHNETTRIYFFSKKTLELHWQKRFDKNMKNNCSYGKGLLLIYVSKRNEKSEKFGVIQVYDVASRTYLREIRITTKYDFEKFDHKVGFHSKFMVVALRSEYQPPYKMNIYDLEAVKNPKSTEDELLVHTVALESYIYRILVDETAVICENKEEIRILDFGSFESFRGKAKSVTMSLPWRGVWRSKGVDEEPLEPVRHMEVYREVLKDFHQLSLDCRAAIETYPIVDPDVASFNLGDDFIGYRQRNPEMVIYDEEMKKRTRKMNYKTVQISKSTHVSVMGKTVQLIDVATGNVFQETKLERDAIGFHFGGNLLVFVSQIAEHEHLLSVWKVENSLKLIHLKDVAIGDYSPFEEYEDSLQVDEHFIAVHTPVENRDTTCNLISLKTFEIERSFSCGNRLRYFYDGGYLFLMKPYFVRILDVVSGTFLRNMPKEPSHFKRFIAKVNSHYAVTVAVEGSGRKSKLSVFDLKCLKETNLVPTHTLLTTIELDCEVLAMMMNETRIVCLSDKNMYVVDLKPVDRLRCPEPC